MPEDVGTCAETTHDDHDDEAGPETVPRGTLRNPPPWLLKLLPRGSLRNSELLMVSPPCRIPDDGDMMVIAMRVISLSTIFVVLFLRRLTDLTDADASAYTSPSRPYSNSLAPPSFGCGA